MKPNKKPSYNFVCFSNLTYEFEISDKKATEKKIKQRLKYYKLGTYIQERVDYIRELKSNLYIEITSRENSKYYSKTDSNFSELSDFNTEQMISDYLQKYSKIEKAEMIEILNFAIYLYHLR